MENRSVVSDNKEMDILDNEKRIEDFVVSSDTDDSRSTRGSFLDSVGTNNSYTLDDEEEECGNAGR